MRYALILTLAASPALAAPSDDAALAYFKAAHATFCVSALDEAGNLITPATRYDLKVPTGLGDTQDLTLWHFGCSMGAYNAADIFLTWTDYDGFVTASFARPELNVVTENPEDPESKVLSVDIIGWTADPVAMNPQFDPATLTLTTYSAWRGIGDAFDGATYVLTQGHFRLTRHEVDASYDGAQSPHVLYAAP
ncbi:DUF1176 domain-containing protein [Rhodobacter sp. KR11]|jgi:hypothetical protein|uniref:DUF1176 domain-containing protein n=1 Tax=Rhodobacter sp. KR11 TaxID=2974588 RepID=UPI002221D395|nr:DUF1176 domain-containing protein [Rhodobacter sp. KR11]MCW1918648.1 DUF1176 domain-containing protein [Rhodobacter sp. KR11]